jgi:hypothetical protein
MGKAEKRQMWATTKQSTSLCSCLLSLVILVSSHRSWNQKSMRELAKNWSTGKTGFTDLVKQ